MKKIISLFGKHPIVPGAYKMFFTIVAILAMNFTQAQMGSTKSELTSFINSWGSTYKQVGNKIYSQGNGVEEEFTLTNNRVTEVNKKIYFSGTESDFKQMANLMQDVEGLKFSGGQKGNQIMLLATKDGHFYKILWTRGRKYLTMTIKNNY